ncbi:kinase-like protein [Serendipita vermifera]|nr:kinase-like protein [Serendipita vermifera]
MADFDWESALPNLSNELAPITILCRRMKGGYSDVYESVWKGQKAKQTVVSQVAVKVISPVNHLKSMKRKVCREAVIWLKLDHPNILRLWGFADREDVQPFGAFISPLHGTAKGVSYLHSRHPPLIHGDIKPANVLIDRDGTPKLCDFGLSKILQEGFSCGLTTTTAHTGTARYLAPELVDPDRIATPTLETDIWALGCVGLKFAFSTEPYAYRPHNLQGILEDIRRGILPAKFPSEMSEPDAMVASLLKACWSWSPLQRPTASQFSERVGQSFPINTEESYSNKSHGFCIPPPGLVQKSENNEPHSIQKPRSGQCDDQINSDIPAFHASLSRLTTTQCDTPRPMLIAKPASVYPNGLLPPRRIKAASSPLSPMQTASGAIPFERDSLWSYTRERSGSTSSNAVQQINAPSDRSLLMPPALLYHQQIAQAAGPPGLSPRQGARTLLPIIEHSPSLSPSRPPTPLRTPPVRPASVASLVHTNSPNRRFNLSLPITQHGNGTSSCSKISVKAVINENVAASGDEMDKPNQGPLVPLRVKSPDYQSSHGQAGCPRKGKRSRLALWGGRKSHVHPNDAETDDERTKSRQGKSNSVDEASLEARMYRARQWIESSCGVH